MVDFNPNDTKSEQPIWWDITNILLYNVIWQYLFHSALDVAKVFVKIIVAYRQDFELIQMILLGVVGVNLLVFRIALAVCKMRSNKFEVK